MTTIKDIEFAYDRFKFYQRICSNDKVCIELAVKDMMKLLAAGSKSVQRN